MTIPDKETVTLRRAVDEIRDDRDASKRLIEPYKDAIRIARKTIKDQGLEIDGSATLTPEVFLMMPSPVNQRYGFSLERRILDEGPETYSVIASVPSLGNVPCSP